MLFSTLQLSMRCIRSNVLRTQNVKMQIRTQMYKDWAHRRPKAVIHEEINLTEAEATPKPRKYVNEDQKPVHEYSPLARRLRTRRGKHPKKLIPPVRSDNTLNEDGTLNLIKVAEDDRNMMNLMMSLKSRKLRERNTQILLEGHRLISDAIQAGLTPEAIICSRTQDFLKMQLPESGVKLYKVPYKTMQLWSGLTTSPGIMGIFTAPEKSEKELTPDMIPLTIICDNVREPGNLGSILRAAAGVGCERVIMTKGCVDVWEPKVLRSAAGAHFRVSINKSQDWDEIMARISPVAKIFAADNNVTMNPEKLSNPAVVKESLDSTSDVECESKEENLSDAENEHETVEEVTLRELTSRLPVVPYYSVDYTTNEVVVIVGGETEGLSYESLKLLYETEGIRVNVPLNNGVESLNTGMALGIVAFEVRRQFAIKKGAASAS